MKRLMAVVFAVTVVFSAGYASASTVSANLAVSTTVVGNCTLTVGSIAFPNYVSGGSDVTGSASVDITCSSGTPWTLDMNGGQNQLGSDRRMANGGNYIAYNIYTDGTYISKTGTSVGGINLTNTGTGAVQSYGAWGKIPGAQTPTPGAYADTVNVTLSY